MKHLVIISAIILSLPFGAEWGNACFAQNIGINPTGSAPNPKALLDVDASPGNNKGLLVPRMTTAERNLITAPIPESLLIYNTTTQCFESYNAASSQWVNFGCIGCMVPGTFSAVAGSSIASTSFSANWTAAAGASTYFLDLSTLNTFTSFVTGYNNLNIGNVLTLSVTGLTCGTTYYYRVRAGNACATSSNSNNITVTTTSSIASPTAGTNTPSATQIIWNWNAVAGANGYQWNTSNTYPGSGVNVVASPSYNQTGLTCNTSYNLYVWAFNSCSNSISTTLSQTTSSCPGIYCTVPSTCAGSITDSRDGKVYSVVQISTQCWMAQNLNVGTRVNGSVTQTTGADNQNTSIEKYCSGDNETNCNTYGGLYQWNEMMAYGVSVSSAPGPQGICPTGWHIPTDNEWKCLEMGLSGMSQATADGTSWRGTDEGGKLKQISTTTWSAPNTGATNSSGFNALASGYRTTGGSTTQDINISGPYWTSTQVDASNSYDRNLYYTEQRIERLTTLSKSFGFSLRCVKN